MRKAIWCATILTLLAGVGAYVIAHHATADPKSFLGRYLTALSVGHNLGASRARPSLAGRPPPGPVTPC